MSLMDVCRVCLTEAVERDITQLSQEFKESTKNYLEIILFCLNIQVKPQSEVTTKLCVECFIKIVSFYKFKTLALKNDAYLHCLLNKEGEKCNTFEMANIKCEDMSNQKSYEYDILCEIEPVCKIELEENEPKIFEKQSDNESKNDDPSDDEVLSIIKKIKFQHDGVLSKGNKKSTKTKAKVQTVKLKKKREKKERETCEECGKTVVKLYEHMQLHRPESERKKFKCQVCDKTFASYGARHTHNKVKHLGIKQHCKECGKYVVDLRNHHLVMHSAVDLPFECVECGQRFITKSKVEQHMMKHSKDRPFVCDICDKDFQHSISLLQHKRRIHDGEKSHLCQVCSKSFFSKYHLKLHIRGHSKEKPVACPDCGKCFSSRGVMKSHQMIHSDTKDFACTLCDMAFKKPGYLRNHMNSHTKEKRHNCPFCDMSFSRSDHRARHERTAHHQPFLTNTIQNTQAQT